VARSTSSTRQPARAKAIAAAAPAGPAPTMIASQGVAAAVWSERLGGTAWSSAGMIMACPAFAR
jgi:hypothetical protein